MTHKVLFRIPAFRRWALQLRPTDRWYTTVRRLLEFGCYFRHCFDAEYDHIVSTSLDMGLLVAHDFGQSCPHEEIKGYPCRSSHTMWLGGNLIWVSNFPYACGERAKVGSPQVWSNSRPSIMTLYRLREAADVILAHNNQGENT